MKPLGLWGLRLLVGGLLGWAGGAKWLNPRDFARALKGYDLLPPSWIEGATYAVPGLEMAAAIALVSGIWRRGGWVWAFILGLSFSIFVGSAWARGLDVNCGCFGGHSPVGAFALARSLGFLGLTALGLRFDRVGSATLR